MSRVSTAPAPRPAAVEQRQRPAWRPTWWMLLASIVALAALSQVNPARHAIAPLMLIPVIAGSYILPYRLRREGPTRWVLRAALFLIVLINAPDRTQSTRFWYLDEAVTSVLGLLAGIELALQHWLGRPGEPRHGIMLWLTSAVFLCATTTPESVPTVYFAPIFALSAAGIIRVFRPQRQVPPSTSYLRPRMRANVFRSAAVVAAILLGFGVTASVEQTREALNRLGASWLPRFNPARGIGMSTSDRLSRYNNLFPSAQRALRLMGTQRAMHLRGMVFDEYGEGGVWLPRLDRRLFDPMPLLSSAAASGPRIEVIRLEDQLNLLYVPLNLARLQSETTAITQIERGHRRVITSITEAGEACNYTFTLGPSLEYQGAICRPLSSEERSACLQVPPPVQQALAQIKPAVDQTTPLRTVVSVVRYLHQNHLYSLEAQFGPGDPIADFLIHKRKAHCQYFASAAVMMLRASGIPARYVTGYYAHEPFGDHDIVVRQRDAHAWTEAWIEGAGWITVDATPATGLPSEQFGKVSAFQRWREKISDWFSATMKWLRHVEWRIVALTGVTLVFVALSIQSLLAHWNRRKAPAARTYAFPGAEVQAIAMEFSSLLRSLGEAPLDSATWTEHLSNQAAQVPAHRTRRQLRLQAAADFVCVYNQIRFGDPENPTALAALREHLNTLKESAT